MWRGAPARNSGQQGQKMPQIHSTSKARRKLPFHRCTSDPSLSLRPNPPGRSRRARGNNLPAPDTTPPAWHISQAILPTSLSQSHSPAQADEALIGHPAGWRAGARHHKVLRAGQIMDLSWLISKRTCGCARRSYVTSRLVDKNRRRARGALKRRDFFFHRIRSPSVHVRALIGLIKLLIALATQREHKEYSPAMQFFPQPKNGFPLANNPLGMIARGRANKLSSVQWKALLLALAFYLGPIKAVNCKTMITIRYSNDIGKCKPPYLAANSTRP